MFLVPIKSQVFKFRPYKILMIILVLHNLVVCNRGVRGWVWVGFGQTQNQTI